MGQWKENDTVKKLMVNLLIGAAGIGGALALAPTAQADSTSGNYGSECSSGYYCVWADSNDRGSKASFQYTNYAWNDTVYAWMEFEDSSSYNKGTSGMGVDLIADLGSSIPHYCSAQGTYWRLHNPNDHGIGNEWNWRC